MKNTLRGKLIIGTIVSVILINVIFTVFISLFLENNLKNNIIEEMKNIKRYAIETIKQNEIIEATRWVTLKEINRISDSYVAMVNKNGEIKEELFLKINDEKISEVVTESKGVSSIINFKKVSKAYCITYSYPIYFENEFYCNLIIQKDYIGKYNEKNNLIIIIVIGQAFVILTLIIIISIIIKKVTDPIKELSSSMENFINEKEVEDVFIESNDEVGQLAKSYNLMKNELKEQMNIILNEKEKVEALQKSSREFFNNATHELKTPLTSISLYAQLLRDDDIKILEEDFIYRATDRMVLECEKMKALVEKILEVSKGKVHHNKVKAQFSLTEIVKELIEDYELRLEKDKLNIIANLEEVSCYGVLDDIESIISNLLDNAIKFSVGDEITINLSSNKEKIEFNISNKCGNIPEDIKERLLEPFIKYNTYESIVKEVSSSGIGLYLCSELSKENNGGITYNIDKNIISFSFRLYKFK